MIDVLQSEPLFTLRLQVAYDRVQPVGALPIGMRSIFPVDGGTFEGPRLKGEVLASGADWVLWRSDDVMLIDVRTALLTHDGALISMQYTGLAYTKTVEAGEAFRRREVAPYDEIYVRTTPRFETSDPRYLWLNKVIAVANGARTEDGPLYHVFQIL
jgi:hypothetical protein